MLDLGHRQRELLAVLLLRANETVTLDHLVEFCFSARVPPSARRQVQNTAGRLRKVLTAAGCPDVITTMAGGYALNAGPDTLDLLEWAEHLQAGRRAAAQGREREAAASLRRGLSLWRGPLLDGIDLAGLEATTAGIEQARMAALEDCLELELRLGHHRDLLPELAALTDRHPLRERLWALRMLAVYRCGARAEALEVYRAARATLVAELGLEPGPPLRRMEQAVLTGDPALNPDGPGDPYHLLDGKPGIRQSPSTSEPHTGTPDPQVEPASLSRPGLRDKPVVPRHLPAGVRDFTGRREQVKLLDGLLPGDESQAVMVISAVSGAAGIGKTALALHWAHRVADRFPDGQFYLNLRGFDPSDHALTPAEALRQCFDALGVSPQRIPAGTDAQAGLYRSLLAGKRVLVLLDDARDEGQVRPLLPASPGCLALITSRDHLAGLVATEGARPIQLGLLTDAEARELLAHRLGIDRITAEPEAVATIISRCARLPLALAVMAARAATQPDFPLQALADQLLDARSALDAFVGADPATDLRAVFSVSYSRLPADAARLFRLLGLHPGPEVSVAAAASLAGVTVAQVRPMLATLTTAQLLIEQRPGRFALHDLLGVYAGELVREQETGAESHAALCRLLDHYVHTGHRAAMLINPARREVRLDACGQGVAVHALTDAGQAETWLSDERSVLIRAIDLSMNVGLDAAAWHIAWALENFLDWRAQWGDFADTQSIALDAAERLDDGFRQFLSHLALGCALISLDRHAEAHTHARQALELAADQADEEGQAEAHHTLAWIHRRRGDFDEAIRHMRLALDLYRAADVPHGQADILNGLGFLYVELGECHQALRCCGQALALFQQVEDLQGQGQAWAGLGYAHHHLGRHDDAVTRYRQALELLRAGRDRATEAETLVHLGDAYAALRSDQSARQAWQDALAVLDELGSPDAEHVRAKLHGRRR
ncbi:BTAD domain-containing putative transcriptional regulator [Nonomuraea maheshkhaliensis]|uniref:BTAD domain-containing putative transcriptional regulator n=1 Tax=Nonomuraea maheshkhaliensis TaxID=419590 RepID=A0ABN2GKV8_9ACTN